MKPTIPSRIELLETSLHLDDSLRNASQCIKEVRDEVYTSCVNAIPSYLLDLIAEMEDALKGAYSHKEEADYLLKVEVTADPEKLHTAHVHYILVKSDICSSFRTIGKIRCHLYQLRRFGKI